MRKVLFSDSFVHMSSSILTTAGRWCRWEAGRWGWARSWWRAPAGCVWSAGSPQWRTPCVWPSGWCFELSPLRAAEDHGREDRRRRDRPGDWATLPSAASTYSCLSSKQKDKRGWSSYSEQVWKEAQSTKRWQDINTINACGYL